MPQKSAWFFLISVVLYILCGFFLRVLLPWADELTLNAVVQIVAILLPALAGGYLLGRNAVGLRMPSKLDVGRIMGMAIAGVWLSAYCNLLIMYLLSRMGLNIPPSDTVQTTWANILPCIAVMVALPAFGEEMLFRGVVQGGSRDKGIMAVWMSSLLFALMHIQPHRLFPLLLLGLVLGYIAYRTRSLVLCMVYHAVKNLVGVLMSAVATMLQPFMQSPAPDDLNAVFANMPALTFSLLFYKALAVCGMMIIALSMPRLGRYGAEREVIQARRSGVWRWPLPLWLGFALLLGMNVWFFIGKIL